MRIDRRRYLVLLTAAAIVVAPVLVGTASGRQSHDVVLACGATVTTSVTLTANVGPCSGSDGLVVAADGITLNLNGHTVSGDGTHYGIRTSSRNSVVVENGVVSQFDYGFVSTTGTSVRVTNMRLSNNTTDGLYAGGSKASITANVATGNAGGFFVGYGTGDIVSNNWANGNAGVGIRVYLAGATTSNNKALSNGSEGINVSGGTGTVSGNVASGNGTDGIYVDSPGVGIKAGVTVSSNRTSFNTQLGINSTAAGSNDGGANVVQDNGTAAQCKNIVCHEVST
jgi:Right handed beta helix region